jgi:uncharacterized protein involved in exopolysaccharide biosynthesis
LAGASGVGQALGLKNPSDLYVSMLQSRTIADAMIQRFGLKELYDEDTLVDTRRRLAEVSRITAGQDGIISIEVDDEVAKRAAEMANGYVEELDRLTQNVSVTTAGRQRAFLERQLRQAKDQLADAEVALRQTQEKTGLISLTEQGKASIESVAYVQAQIQAKQVQLAAMRTGMTESNPEYIRAQRELVGLRSELSKLERGASKGASAFPSAGNIPEAGLEFVRKFRDVQYFQTLFELIAKQYEIAKAQEAAEGGLIQVLDAAVPQDKKSKPHRTLIVVITGILAGLFGVAAAFILDARKRAEADPVQSRLLDELRRQMPPWLKSRRE